MCVYIYIYILANLTMKYDSSRITYLTEFFSNYFRTFNSVSLSYVQSVSCQKRIKYTKQICSKSKCAFPCDLEESCAYPLSASVNTPSVSSCLQCCVFTFPAILSQNATGWRVAQCDTVYPIKRKMYNRCFCALFYCGNIVFLLCVHILFIYIYIVF